jgi:hypothetical protein
VSNYEWVKKTFEENDAGFRYALETKGEQAYTDHNKRILEKVKNIKTLSECTPVLYEWLTFFRSGHIGIKLNEKYQQTNTQANTEPQKFSDWETYSISTEKFKKYLDNKKDIDYEGIWESAPYKIGITKQGNQYIGFIIESGAETWTAGQIKLKFTIDENKTSSVFYMRNHSAVESENVSLTGKNHLQVGNTQLVRIYPKIEETEYTQYFKSIEATSPYLEELNKTTLYFRIPSFGDMHKKAIDSVIAANRDKILKTENLIIDIHNGTGGSDGSYREILPFIYTNPIRGVGVEYFSTKLNNQRMLDFINNPDEYGLDEEDKKWAKNAYEKLEKNLGKYVNIGDDIVSTTKFDTIYPYPKNVGIIINQQNGSTDEQFLLAAKQSKKVKLFGTTTFGVLDISNMYFVDSPCKEFELGYSLSRSMRIPDFTIDGKGIQPDYYLDKSIPPYEWTDFVNKILNGQE